MIQRLHMRESGGGHFMRFKSIFRAGLVSLIAVYPLSAHAATLNGIVGGIFVSQGAGYQAARAPVHLKPGDSVLANPGSSAQVVFDDGCVVPIQPGMVFAVGETSPCIASAVPPASPVNWPLVAGAIVVAGGVGIAIAAGGGGGGGGTPASP